MDIKFSGSDAGGFQFDPNAAPKPKHERKPRKSIGSKGGRIAVNTLVTLLVGAVFFYVQLPAINLHAEEFYGFVLLLCVTYCICALFTSGFQGTGAKGYFTFVKKQCTVPFIVMALMIVTALVGALTSWVVLRAKDYQALLPIESGSFASEIEEVSYDRIPMLDRDSAEKLGDRKLGELADMVSQFEVAETTRRSTTMAAPCASRRCATATSSSGSTTVRRGCPPTSSSTWSRRTSRSCVWMTA